MEQKNNFNQGLSNIWLIVIIALASALVVGGVVYAWQKIAANNKADKLQQQVNDLQNQIQNLQNNQANNGGEQQFVDCLKEGESGSDDAGATVPNVCCVGLVKVEPVDTFSEGAICKTPGTIINYDPFRCTYCGNGICGTGENKCNCPEDCKNSADMTANWKTYTNTQNTYKIKYPEAQGIKVFVTDPNAIELRPQYAWEPSAGHEGGWEPTRLDISVKTYSSSLALLDYLVVLWNDSLGRTINGQPVSKSQIKTVTIGNISFYNLDDIQNAEQNYYVIHDNKLYTLFCFGKQEFRNQCQQMLATFEFTK